MGSPWNLRQPSIISYTRTQGQGRIVRAELRVLCWARRASLLQSLGEHACQTTLPSFHAISAERFLLPFAARARGFSPQMDENSLTLRGRLRSSTSATAFPKLVERWPN